ncbi:MAG TPA: HEAT repeat domain-containing protein, partial [Terriglobia bacterium]|nr:HEAT repeat domain-containing protein [Terriglobia bacterium]
PAAGHDAPKNFYQSVRAIRRSRYLLLLTSLIAIGCLATSILGYQFFLIAKGSFGHNTAALTAFVARFYGYMGLITLVFQLALTGPLLRTFGIRLTLFALPMSLLASSVGVFFDTGLITGSLLRGSHYILRYSLDKSSTELLYLPVAPEVKSQVKSFIDTFVWRSADGMAGLLLLLFANVLKFGPGKVSLVNICILLGWVGVAYGVRNEYLNVLRQAIERRTLDPEKTAAGLAGVIDSTTSEALAMSFQRAGEQQALYGLSLFEMGHDASSHPALRGLLEHSSPAVRQRALRLLGDAGDTKILPQVEKLLKDESPEVRTEALHYLVLQTGRDPLSLLESESDFMDYSLAGSVVAYLARTGQDDNVATAQAILMGMLARTGPDAVRAHIEAARALGAIPPPSDLHLHLLNLLTDEHFEVREQALLSAGKIRSRQFLPLVIESLGERRLRGAARAALVEYGDHAVGTLQDYLNDDAVTLAVRKQVPGVLARIATPEAAAVLANNLVQPDPGLRFDVLKALNKLRQRDSRLLPRDADFADMLLVELMGYYRSLQILEAFEPHSSELRHSAHSLSVLTRALGERMDYEFERIFRLLGLIYPARDVYNAYMGMKSGRAQLHANALEVLEHLLKPEHYRLLSYVLDPEIGHAEKLSFAARFCRAGVESKTEALRILLQSDDRWLRACSVHTIGELRMAELHDELLETPHEDALLEETWKWAAARLGATA